jgi:hypothetical protein
MMKRVTAYVCAVLAFAALSLTQFASAGGGGGGGNKRCVNHHHSINPWAITCRREDNCEGACFKLDWMSRDCIPGDEKCDPTRLRVPRVMKRALCLLVPNDPTCECSREYRAVGVLDTVEVDWCN